MQSITSDDGQITKKFHIEEDVDFRIAFLIPSSVPFPGDSFFTGANTETRETTLWQPPADEWTLTPQLIVENTCDDNDNDDLFASMPDPCSFADAYLPNKDELQAMLQDYVASGQVQYKPSRGSLRKSTDMGNGFSIYQLSLWWGASDSARPTQSDTTATYSYTQSIEDWQHTVEFCGNYRSTCQLNTDGTVTKTYVVTNDANHAPMWTDMILFA